MTMENFEDIKTFLLESDPFTIVFLASISFGYLVKTLPLVPSYLIAKLCVTVASLLFRYSQKIEQQDFQEWFNPALRLYIVGALIGFAAWNTHNRFLKKLIDSRLWPDDKE